MYRLIDRSVRSGTCSGTRSGSRAPPRQRRLIAAAMVLILLLSVTSIYASQEGGNKRKHPSCKGKNLILHAHLRTQWHCFRSLCQTVGRSYSLATSSYFTITRSRIMQGYGAQISWSGGALGCRNQRNILS